MNHVELWNWRGVSRRMSGRWKRDEGGWSRDTMEGTGGMLKPLWTEIGARWGHLEKSRLVTEKRHHQGLGCGICGGGPGK